MQNHRLCESPIDTSRAEGSCKSQLHNTPSQKKWGTYQIKPYCAAPGHILLSTEQHSPTATSPRGKSPHSLHLPSHFCNDETQCHIILHDFRLWLNKSDHRDCYLFCQERSWWWWQVWDSHSCSYREHKMQVRKETTSPYGKQCFN